MENVEYPQIDKTLNISWMLPCQPNGRIKQFLLSWKISDERTARLYAPGKELINAQPNQFSYSFPLTNIKPEIKYSFAIRAESDGFKGEEFKWEVTTDPEGEFLFQL